MRRAPRSGTPPPPQVTLLLTRLRNGNHRVLDRLMPLVHDELRALARKHMREERAGHTLQPTALAHEAYLRLVNLKQIDWRGRAHFFGVAAGIMRRILIDHARKRRTARRGAAPERVPLEETALLAPERPAEFIALDEALSALRELDPRQEQIVEMRFFGGLSVGETAAVLRISPRTVKRDWAVARAWLRAELGR